MEVAEAVGRYIDECAARMEAGDLSAITEGYYRGVLRRLIVGLEIRELHEVSDEEWRSAWSAGFATANLRPRSQRVYRATICRWLDWCVGKKWLSSHTMRAVACDRLDAAHRPKISVKRYCSLLDAAESLPCPYDRARARALLLTAWSALLRWAEILSLRVYDVRLDDDPPRLRIDCGKGGWSGWMPLSDAAVAGLRAWLVMRSHEDYGGPPPHEWLWCNTGSMRKRMGRTAWPRLLKQLADIAGFDAAECKTHGIRRGSATAMLQSGADIATVSAQLRHANIQTTWDYVEADDLRLASVRNWFEIQNRQASLNAPAAAERQIEPSPPDRKLLKHRAVLDRGRPGAMRRKRQPPATG